MELLKRLTIPAMALIVVLQFCGCSQLDMEDEGGSGPIHVSDSKKAAEKKAHDEASRKVQTGYVRISQALSLTQMAIQAKITAATATEAAPAAPQPMSADPSKAGMRPAPAKGAGNSSGAPTAKQEGVAPGTETGPKMPELIPTGTLANEMVGQAYAIVEDVRKETTELCCSEKWAKDASLGAKIASLKGLIEAATKLIGVAAGMDPVNPDVTALMKAEPAKVGAGSTSGGAAATSGGTPAAPTSSSAGPSLPISKGH